MLITRPGIYVINGTLVMFGIAVLYSLTRSRPIVTVGSKISTGNNAADQEDSKEKVSFDDFKDVPQDDPEFIEFLRKEVIHPPSTGKYNLKNPEKKHFSELDQSKILDAKIFHGKKNGFFIEVGAIDGEFLSNSLYFERELGWTGLLIEPNHDTFEKLLKKGRKAYSVNGALAHKKSPHEMLFSHQDLMGKSSRISKTQEGASIKAYPLYSLLLAIKVNTIDFFSLDIEGQEMKVLPTLPWEKLKFKVLCIEQLDIPGGPQNLINLIESKGYKYVGTKQNDAWFVAPELWNKNLTFQG